MLKNQTQLSFGEMNQKFIGTLYVNEIIVQMN